MYFKLCNFDFYFFIVLSIGEYHKFVYICILLHEIIKGRTVVWVAWEDKFAIYLKAVPDRSCWSSMQEVCINLVTLMFGVI